MKNPLEILKKYWGFTSFRGSQEEIITAILKKQDTLALLPTGGGKSICFQIPALANDGICIVVSPLIALIQNQVNHLKERGIKAIALTGGIPFHEVNQLLDNCLYGNYKFLYLSPERLQQEIVQERIQKMNVNLIAIDEAHCISQWGHDFRPAYLKCGELRNLFPKVPIVALTATATKKVVTDIVDLLQFETPLVVKDSFARKNIAFKVYWEEDKRYRLKQYCMALRKSAIVYVRTRRLAQEIAQYLSANKLSSTYFHGGIPKQEKEKKLHSWLNNDIKIMVATNAFGMGIDKPDVSLVVHYQIPDCLENYFQEAGRAGRDGNPAEAIIITNNTDIDVARKQFLDALPDSAFLKFVYNKLNNYFRIAYGEGQDSLFLLNFSEFCSVYSLPAMRTYNALQILDRNSVIALNTAFKKQATVQFLATKEQLYSYFAKNSHMVPIIQTILRTYGGIFDFETKINVPLLAKKTNTTITRVKEVLNKLLKDEIIAYKALHSDLEVTFLVPREDDITINVFAKKVAALHKIKANNLNHMLNYVSTNKTCRSKQLLHYFGERAQENCGICDVCVQSKPIDNELLQVIKKDILTLLKEKRCTSRQLIASLTYKESLLLQSLQELLEEDVIKINTRNEYELG